MPANRLQQAQQFHQDGDLNAALAIYEELLQEDPKQTDVLHNLSILLSQKNLPKEALTTIQQAIELDPTNALLHNTMGLIYSRQAQIEKAIASLQHALELNPEFASAHNNLANAYRKQDNIEAAIEHYESAIKLDSNYVDALFNLALLYMHKEQYNTAEQYLRQTIDKKPEHIQAHSHLAQLYLQQKQYEKAVEHFNHRIAVQPDHIDSLHDQALAYIELAEYDKAIVLLKQVIELDPNHEDSHHNLGIAYLKSARYSDALPCFLQQLETKPYIEAYFNLGVLLMYENRLKEANEYFLQTLELDPKHKDSLINLGVMHLKSNHLRPALDYYKKALNLEPDNTELQHIVSALQPEDDAATKAPEDYVKHLFNQYSPYYDVHLKQALKYQVPNKIYELLNQQTYLPNNRWSVCDIGCGTGLMGERLSPFTSELVGIDLSEMMIECASQKNIYTQLICDDVVEGIKQCGEFDFITAADVFTYIGDLKPILSECYHHLKTEGYLCFSVEQGYQTDSYYLLPTIRYAHNPNYLKQLAEELGYEQIEQQNIVLRHERDKPIEGLVVLWQRTQVI